MPSAALGRRAFRRLRHLWKGVLCCKRQAMRVVNERAVSGKTQSNNATRALQKYAATQIDFKKSSAKVAEPTGAKSL